MVEVEAILMSSTSMFLSGKYSLVVIDVCDKGDKDALFGKKVLDSRRFSSILHRAGRNHRVYGGGFLRLPSFLFIFMNPFEL